MSAPRLAASLLLRASRSSVARPARQFRSLPTAACPVSIPKSHLKFYSQEPPSTAPAASKIYLFEDIQKFSSSPDPERILIDTREPSELETTGKIPGSINIPVTSQPDSFFITEEEFEDRFGFERPEKNKELVFYCKAGVRSRAAAELAKMAGWTKIRTPPNVKTTLNLHPPQLPIPIRQ
ncbi:hypothetical protein G7Y89_g798 [Cudoniella acicularis]|uniref:Rhodanese domain-containing protein n=1 Tax=Cudoniella acicularis TaxID=354080 RepID=A0A8H4W7L1_9HELO|nr:hypothetical protein G7Y89_g798 [Cudoniella acicularis]